ncbi:MAG: hypothetical protein ACYC6C_01545 [Coriobacteriia bacterium]
MIRDLRPRLVLAISIALAMCLLIALTGCATEKKATLDPPAEAVDSLLELRYERSTDASAYAEYVSPELAAELARASEEETSSTPPTPRWEPPYVSAEGSATADASATADVVVVWKDRADYPEWPPATIFAMSLIEGDRWVASDARTLGETETVPPAMD